MDTVNLICSLLLLGLKDETVVCENAEGNYKNRCYATVNQFTILLEENICFGNRFRYVLLADFLFFSDFCHNIFCLVYYQIVPA